MKLFKGKRRKKLTRKEMFESYPVRNEADKVERDGDGLRLTFLPKRDGETSIMSLLTPKPSDRTFELDAVGTFVWNMCDGKHSTAEIADALTEDKKLDTKEAEVALLTYLKTLARKGVISLQMKQDD